MFSNIPDEMKSYRQWIVWKFENTTATKPTKVPYSPVNGKRVSVHDRENWGTFQQCIDILYSNGHDFAGLGFVLTKEDPFAFIDLDDAGGDTVAGDRQQTIYNEFKSYSEYSPSGIGCHIIVKGSIPSGRKRSKIEIYSAERFMTMTGNTIRHSPVIDYNEWLNALYSQMGTSSTDTSVVHGESEQTMDDLQVVDMAINAVNGDKFKDLHDGEWQKHYESQSEADLAYINIIAFYTQNREQIQRMFNDSPLGARAKKTSIRGVDYVNYMINKSFDKMLPPLDMDGLRNRIEEFLAKSNLTPSQQVEPDYDDEDYSEDAGVTDSAEITNLIGNRAVYSVPPGLMGDIAQYLYTAAPRPVPEIALAGALGLMAGITGRAYNTPTGSGLNTYTLLIAKTGRGKEAISSGIEKLIRAVSVTLPQSTDIVGPGEIASAQALAKYMAKGKNSFVSIVGEFGLYLQQMASERAAPHMIMLKRTLLDFYNKSGEGNYVRPSIYADSDKNTVGIMSPNLSIIGESTPVRFYGGLTENMISEGLLSRFTIIEYHGVRVPLNKGALGGIRPPMDLVDRLSQLCAYAQALNVQNKAIHVRNDPQAEWVFNQFGEYCDNQINSASEGSDEIISELWNRAQLKAYRIASQVAVGCNMIDPVIDEYTANWAINIVVEDARNIIKRFQAGEIGMDNNEAAKLKKMGDTMREYLESPWSKVCKYAGVNFSGMHAERIIPYAFLSRKLIGVACFKNEPRGATNAIKETLRTMIERGDISEVSRQTLAKDFDCRAAAYVVVNPHALG